MSTARTQEALKPKEKLTAAIYNEEQAELAFSRKEIDAALAQRATQLAGVERFLRVRTREFLRAKIEHEKFLLLSLIEREKQARAAAKKALHVLNRTYFTQKPLDMSIFE